MKYFSIAVLLLLSFSSRAEQCSSKAIIKSGDDFKYSASLYLVCPEFVGFSEADATKTILSLMLRYESYANEVFVAVLSTDRSVGFMEREPYKAKTDDLIGDFYNISGKLFILPDTANEREIVVRPPLAAY